MKNRRITADSRKGAPASIKTSLLQALPGLTKDAAFGIPALKSIFATYRVRFGRKLAPVRLVPGKASMASLRCTNVGKRSSAWA